MPWYKVKSSGENSSGKNCIGTSKNGCGKNGTGRIDSLAREEKKGIISTTTNKLILILYQISLWWCSRTEPYVCFIKSG
jgi:hypothetical protein